MSEPETARERAIEAAPDLAVVFGEQFRGRAHGVRRVRCEQTPERRQRKLAAGAFGDDAAGRKRAQQVQCEAVAGSSGLEGCPPLRGER